MGLLNLAEKLGNVSEACKDGLFPDTVLPIPKVI